MWLRPGGGDPVLEAVGELDQYTGGLLDAAVHGAWDAVPAAGELVLDMAGVRFCDSGGLNAVLRAHLRAQAAGAVLHVVAPTARVMAMLRRRGEPGTADQLPRAGIHRGRAGSPVLLSTRPPRPVRRLPPCGAQRAGSVRRAAESE
ncbi:STAS domain-containing protein [Kitasatospora herbaricolor]|uniref:STAS domain-containing protein n=1 Tax=Kitasatospora herbaricolor TaxID=68217 RepID=UPI0039A6B304